MSIDDYHQLLHAAGWSIGDAGFGNQWYVIGTNGENVIEARGESQGDAWRRAVEQAQSLGMFRNVVKVDGGRF